MHQAEKQVTGRQLHGHFGSTSRVQRSWEENRVSVGDLLIPKQVNNIRGREEKPG